MSANIKRMIKRRSKPYIIQRFDRKNGYYNNDGLWIDEKEEKEYISLHWQPKTDQLNDGFAGQQQTDTRHAWSVDIVKANNKDTIIIGDGIFTISNVQYWDEVYKEFDLTRTGENDNEAE